MFLLRSRIFLVFELPQAQGLRLIFGLSIPILAVVKKFFAIAVLAVIVAGAVFLVGWAQLALSPGTCGVLRSKTHGVDKQIILGGGFDWLWYRLIPGNAEMAVFRLSPQKLHLEFSGKLAEADVLAAFTGSDAGFSWEASADVDCTVQTRMLPALVEQGEIEDQASLDAYLGQQSAEMEAEMQQRLSAYFAEDAEERFAEVMENGTLPTLEADMRRAFSFIDGLDCRIRIKKMPDLENWNASRALYSAYLDRQRQILQNDALSVAEKRIASQFRFDELVRYGELLTKYPVLIQYLAIEQKANAEERQ